MFSRFYIANRFCIALEATNKDSVYRHIHAEYKDYNIDIAEDHNVPTIGHLQEIKSELMPNQYRELVKDYLYEDDNYLYFRYHNKAARISLLQEYYDITYQVGFSGSIIFHLTEVLTRLYAHKYGLDFFHASSFKYNDKVYMINGFGGSGKTEIMLNALFKGATYISDDLVIINENAEIFPYTVSIPVRWSAINIPFMHRIDVSPKVYEICKYCKKKNGKITRRIYSYFAMRYLFGEYPYPRLTDKKTDMHFYNIDNCLWIQTSNTNDRFTFSNAEFYRYMDLCLENESRKYFDLEGFLMLKFPEISAFKHNREVLRKNICNKLKIQSIGVADRDYLKIANYILSSN